MNGIYSKADFEADLDAYNNNFLFDSLEDVYEYNAGVLEVENDLAAERACEAYYENRGYDEARLQEHMEAARGIFA